MAPRHVLEGRRIVFEQARRLDVLKRDGHPTAMAESLLDSFECALTIFEDDLARLLNERSQAAGVPHYSLWLS